MTVDPDRSSSRARGVPRIPSWYVPRPHLVDDALGSGAALVVLRAPAGSGKSALATEVAHRAAVDECQVVWVDVSRSRDRASLWQLVLHRLRGRSTDSAEHATRRPDAPPENAWPERLAEDVEEVGRPVLLVLDAYDTRHDDTTDTDVVDTLAVCPQLTILTTTRARTGLEGADVALELDVLAMGPDELTLTPDEIVEMAHRSGVEVSADRVGELVDATGGSPRFVRAALLAARSGALDLALASSRTIAASAAGSGRALLDRMDDHGLRDALQLLAVPAGVTEDLAERLAPDHPEALETCEQLGLGAWVDEENPAFVLTPVARAALRLRLRSTDPGREADAQKITTEWALETGDFFLGFESSVEMGDHTTAQRILLAHWAALARKDPPRVARILSSISLGAMSRSPFLAIALAVSYLAERTHRVRAAEVLAVAAAGAVVRYPRAAPGERALLLGVQSVAYRLLGRGEQSAKVARRALEIFRDVAPGDDPDLDAARPLGLRQLGVSLLSAGDISSAIRATAASTVATPDDEGPTIQADARISGLLAVAGEIDRAADVLDRVPASDALIRAYGPYRASMATLARAIVALERGVHHDARLHLTSLDDEMQTNEFWPLHALAWAQLGLVTGLVVDAGARLDDATAPGARVTASSLWRGRLDVARSCLALAGGRPDEAAHVLRGLPTNDSVVRTARARLHHLRTEDDQALRVLGQAPDPTHGVRAEIEHLVVRGLCVLATGDRPAAARDLRRAATQTRKHGCRTPWSLTTRADRESVAALLDDDLTDVLTGLPVVVPDELRTTELSERELLVLQHLSLGLGTAEIARELHVSPNTVKTQLKGVYRKLGVQRSADALVESRRRGILG
ncbi:helix-turn-helix transcriptional regulator [Oerskovia flava]|uniref:helix-turn-helix transcriptional regulator n=1 Tax=Oerskovia flava TaxID=2986422 RepID=UPI00223EF80E|nr:LuxR C-terminal-related transcriptional regulator [Oerskovia sp. JB1-3-2]